MSMSRDGVLKRTDLINNVAIQCDQVRRCYVLLDFSLGHDVRRHVICDQLNLDAHFMERRGGKLGTLEIRSSFRRVDSDVLALLPCKGK